MIRRARDGRRLTVLLAGITAVLALGTACLPTPPTATGSGSARASAPMRPQPVSRPPAPGSGGPLARPPSPPRRPPGTTSATTSATPGTTAARPTGTFTFAFAGDVHFSGRVADRLADPGTAFGVAETQLQRADLTMVNLETAITDRGEQQDKSYTFRAPATALSALHEAGVDIATMANNHGADYGATGLQDSLAAIAKSPVHVIGIGADSDQAYRPFLTTVNGVKVAVVAATQVHDETLSNWTAGEGKPGVASAFSDRLPASVRAARRDGYAVIAYLHWGTEYTTCPNAEQRDLADELADAGAAAVIGTHAHVLQGAGWRKDGVYVAYGLSNYLWWKSFGNEQDDNGALTLTFAGAKVTAAQFVPAHLDDSGVPVPATGTTKQRIDAEWTRDRKCADLAAAPGG